MVYLLDRIQGWVHNGPMGNDLMDYNSVLLAIDKYQEESEEEELYREWMLEMEDWQGRRSLWNSVGGIVGGIIGSMFGNPAAGYMIGSTITTAADTFDVTGTRPDAPEALEFGGKFDTQGEREAEFAMLQAQPSWMDPLNMLFSNMVNYYKMGGDFSLKGDPESKWFLGKSKLFGGEGFGKDAAGVDAVVDAVKDTADMTLPEKMQQQISDFMNEGELPTMQQAVAAGTAYAMLDMYHPGIKGTLPGVWTPPGEDETETSQTPSSTTGGPSEDDTERLYQEWLAQMGLQSPTYTPTGYGSV